MNEEDNPEENYHYITIQVTSGELKQLKKCFNDPEFDVKIIIQPSFGYDAVYSFLLHAITNAALYRAN